MSTTMPPTPGQLEIPQGEHHGASYYGGVAEDDQTPAGRLQAQQEEREDPTPRDFHEFFVAITCRGSDVVTSSRNRWVVNETVATTHR